ncbi:MAG: glycosyltransferase family 2 protein [Lachnospiraceae bacterium]|nr:glycosyltransferase family 2 protein [Lachnospiraceae bacterium]
MTISVCLIVKNEAAILARCLDPLVSIADETVIVDTGSTDETKKIASRYTQKIYDLEWKDDFAAARNFAFSKCSCDYIYSADADEVLDEVNLERFKKLKSALDPSVDIVQFIYTNQLEYNTTYNFDRELRPKLYRRLRPFVWEGEVHEQVRLDPLIYDSDIEVIHKPTSFHSSRDLAIFRRIIGEKGGMEPRLSDMYMRELAVSGEDEDFVEARAYFEKLIETETDPARIRDELYTVIRGCRVSDDRDAFMKYAFRALALGEVTSETAFELGEFYRTAGDPDEAKIWYYNAAYETEASLDHRYKDEYPLRYLKDGKKQD